MSHLRGRLVVLLTGLTLALSVAVPATLPFAQEGLSAQPLAAEYLPSAALPAAATAVQSASLRLGTDLPALFSDAVLADATAATPAAPVRTAAADRAAPDAETICLAKAVRHEAGGQSHDGQLAVAQLIVNRKRSGRFADTICGVVNQQGQFFATAAYHPDTATPAWENAVAIAQAAMADAAPSVAPGALFFHAAFQAPRAFFRGRQRVTMLGGNIFYR